MRLLLCHTDYRLSWPPRLDALRLFLSDRSVDMKVVEIAGKGSPYAFDAKSGHDGGNGWQVLFPGDPMEAIPPRSASAALFKALDEWSPDAVLAGPIAFPSGATAVRWARRRNKLVIITDNARLTDVPRNAFVTWVKRRIYDNVDAVLLPAPSHVGDYEFWGLSRERMFFGVNTVDNAFFAERAARARADAERLRGQGGLPRRFLLGVGRQVPKKNWRRFLHAWNAFKGRSPATSLQLVLVGEGPDRRELEQTAAKLGLSDVQFRDYTSQEEIATLYGLAHGLVLPSRHGETWGLVVNEAMASGLPVLVSRECGCAATLVEEGGNGWCFAPDSREDMANALVKLDSLSEERWRTMSDRSRGIVADWGLGRFCQGVWEALCFTREARPPRIPRPLDRAILRIWNGRYRPA